MQPQENIPAILDDLYAGAIDEPAWNRAMLGIADLVRGVDALLLSYDPSSGTVPQEESHRIDRTLLAEYTRDWVAKDIRLPFAVHAPIDQPQFETRLMPWRRWSQSEIYNDFLRPIDLATFLCTWLHKSPTRVTALTIQGSPRRGPFGQQDARLIQPVLSHVRRALLIRDRLRHADVRVATLAASLDHAHFAVIVLDDEGRIVDVNAEADRMLCSERGVRRRSDGTLQLRDPAGSDLRRWMTEGTPPPGNSDGLLRIDREAARPISVLAVRLPLDTSFWMCTAPRWLLLLFDPERRLLASREIIACDLGVSEREAEIAALLAAGYDLKTAATRLYISVHTARCHLKAIYAKSGVRSQSELVRRIACGPAAFAPRTTSR